jgi:hypothetical protein
MNKNLCIFIFSLLLAGFILGITPAKAQTTGVELPSSGLTPDSPFYFLERFFEGVGTFFTFGDIAKAKRYAKLAAERIAEAKAVVDKGKPEAAEIALIRYQNQLGKSLAKAEQARTKGKSISEITEIVAQATSQHLAVLEAVSEKVPEQARIAILQARESSITGQVKALENLAKEKPEKAALLSLQAIQNRLEKAKKEVREGNEENTERALIDFDVFRASLEKMGKENKMTLASLVSENMTDQIEDLDKVEDEAESISPRIAEKVQAIKGSAINGQIEVLRNLASIDPEKAAEIFSQAAEKRLNKAKQDAEEKDTEEVNETVEEFEKYALFGQEISEIAQGIGKETTTVEQLVAKATSRHLEILNEAYNKAPEQAKEAIKKAMTVSEIGRQQVVEALKEKGALENIPETVPIPNEIKQRVFQERSISKPTPKSEESEKPEIEETPEKPEAKKPGTEEMEKSEKKTGLPNTVPPGPPVQPSRP